MIMAARPQWVGGLLLPRLGAEATRHSAGATPAVATDETTVRCGGTHGTASARYGSHGQSALVQFCTAKTLCNEAWAERVGPNPTAVVSVIGGAWMSSAQAKPITAGSIPAASTDGRHTCVGVSGADNARRVAPANNRTCGDCWTAKEDGHGPAVSKAPLHHAPAGSHVRAVTRGIAATVGSICQRLAPPSSGPNQPHEGGREQVCECNQ